MKTLLRISLVIVALSWVILLNACSPAATPVLPPVTSQPTPANTVAPTDMPAKTVAPADTPAPMPVKKPGFKLLPLPAAVIKDKIEVNGHKLYVACYGKGSPTVVLEHGFAADTATWNSIVPYVAAETQVCAYDRFNTGQSGADFGLLTMDQVTADLHALRQALKIEGPIITVGHSIGGAFAVAYAIRYADDVAGVVLVDSAYPNHSARYLAALPAPAASENPDITSLRKTFVADVASWKDCCELSNWDKVAAQFESSKLGDTPLVALTQAKKPAANWPDLPADLADRLEDVWQGIQRDYAAMSSNGQVIVAEDSGHGIQWDQPQLVLDAILAVVKTARK